MALATRCPHCSTVFKVANDQLKLRGGLVRCGVCQQVFNGVEGLVKGDQPAPPDAVSAPPATAATPPAFHAVAPSVPQVSPPGMSGVPGAGTSVPHGGSLLVRPAANDAPATPAKQAPSFKAPAADASHAPRIKESQVPSGPVTPAAGGRLDRPALPEEARCDLAQGVPPPTVDPMLRMTLLDIAQAGHAPLPPTGAASGPTSPAGPGSSSDDASDPNPASDPLAEAIDELNARPVTGSLPQTKQDEEDRAIDPDLSEPSFLTAAHKPTRLTRFWKTGVILLAVFLALQLVYLARHRIVSAVPQAATLIEGMCSVLRCDIGLPADIDSVTIESSELQQAPGSQPVFTLSFSLQNTSGMAQAWPHVELTLNDTAEQPVVRRVFTPEEYVTFAPRREQGLPRQSLASFRLTFELRQPKAAGYRLYVFYP